MADDDTNSEPKEPPKSSSTTYFAEGDKLFKKNEFRKAIESYSMVSLAILSKKLPVFTAKG